MGGAGKTTSAANGVHSRRRRWLKRAALALLGCVLLLVSVHQFVYWSGTAHMYAAASVPERPVILVLGASVRPGGRPSDMLADRLQVAAELYHAGKAKKILVSGDHGHRDYDEVRPMAEALQRLGVPAHDVFLDHAGFRTLDSTARAHAVFGAKGAIVVSNPFHVPRAVFLARQFGIDAVGVGAVTGRRYSRGTRWRHGFREALARILAFCDVFVLGTEPRFLGPRIDLLGDGRVTRDHARAGR